MDVDATRGPRPIVDNARRDSDLLTVKLAELNALKSEIGLRSDLQNRILQIYVTALTFAIGVIVVYHQRLDLVALVPLAAMFSGMWYIDHALAIEGIACYIATDVEHPINNSVLNMPRAMRWETVHMTEDIRWPESKSWRFGQMIIFTFLFSSAAAIAVLIALVVVRLWRLAPSDGLVVEDVGLIAADLFAIAVGSFLVYQFCALTRHWQNECGDRPNRIAKTIAYRFMRATFDPDFGQPIQDLVTSTYSFRKAPTDTSTDLTGWLHYAKDLKETGCDGVVTVTLPDSAVNRNAAGGQFRHMCEFLGWLRKTLRPSDPSRANEFSLPSKGRQIQVVLTLANTNGLTHENHEVVIGSGRVSRHWIRSKGS